MTKKKRRKTDSGNASFVSNPGVSKDERPVASAQPKQTDVRFTDGVVDIDKIPHPTDGSAFS
jgi:hypothetical protein